MKRLYFFILKVFVKIPLPSILLRILDEFISTSQGKGWGDSSIDDEVKNCFNLLETNPKIFIDIGANEGNYTEKVLKKSPKTICHIFEPQKYNIEILKKKFFKLQNIYIRSEGLSNKNHKAILFTNKAGSGHASLTKRKIENFDLEEEIEIIRFDNYWKKNYSTIDYVKIDVEGHELDVLEGFGKLIDKTKLIQFEFGGCNIDTRTFFRDYWEFFKEKNFEIHIITPRGTKFIKNYRSSFENFRITNYIALNKKYKKI